MWLSLLHLYYGLTPDGKLALQETPTPNAMMMMVVVRALYNLVSFGNLAPGIAGILDTPIFKQSERRLAWHAYAPDPNYFDDGFEEGHPEIFHVLTTNTLLEDLVFFAVYAGFSRVLDLIFRLFDIKERPKIHRRIFDLLLTKLENSKGSQRHENMVVYLIRNEMIKEADLDYVFERLYGIVKDYNNHHLQAGLAKLLAPHVETNPAKQ